MDARQKTRESKNLSPFEHVYEIVRKIPCGKVYTYGLISKRMNKRLSAAAVGWAMNGLGNGKNEDGYNSNNVPWHRVINSKGKLSTQIDFGTLTADSRPDNLQRILLEQEGVVFRNDESIDLNLFLWNGE
ncbi:MAG: MGMT family protein [Candidatus Melainabacteria bacterium]|nr:MGMT family protein [Candidatus Melainabacteria bacterium]